jgi:hypothetical protein
MCFENVLNYFAQSGDLTEPESVLDATVKMGYTLSLSSAKDRYLQNMQRIIAEHNT